MTQRRRIQSGSPPRPGQSVGIPLGLALGWATMAPLLGSAASAQAEPAVSPDPYQAHAARAEQLFRSEQYIEAIKEMEAAYSLRQVPQWLFALGQAHQRLGHASEARLHYQRYLVSSGLGGDSEQRREASQRLEELNRLLGVPEPQQPVAPSFSPLPYRVEVRPHHRGMLAAGWSMLAVGYAAAFATGTAFAVIEGGSRSSSSLGSAGGTLLIPVAGPVVSSAVAYNSILYWGLPWLLIDLPLQVCGLALIIKGYTTPQKVVVPNTNLDSGAVSFTPYLSPGGGGLSAAGRF